MPLFTKSHLMPHPQNIIKPPHKKSTPYFQTILYKIDDFRAFFPITSNSFCPRLYHHINRRSKTQEYRFRYQLIFVQKIGSHASPAPHNDARQMVSKNALWLPSLKFGESCVGTTEGRRLESIVVIDDSSVFKFKFLLADW